MFVFFWLCFSCQVGVFADELKSVSVMEGDSVTLQTDVNEIHKDDEIMWTFGTNRNLLAETDGVTSKIPDDLDGRFRDRLKLDNQTGSLTITNIRTEHAGVYEAEISNSSSETKHRFNVTVYATTTTPGQQHSTSPPTLPSTLRPTLRPASRSTSRSTSGSSGSDNLIVQISTAAAGFLLIAASVGIFYIYRKHRKTDQQVENRQDEITYANPTFYKRNAQTVKQEDEVVYAAVVTRR